MVSFDPETTWLQGCGKLNLVSDPNFCFHWMNFNCKCHNLRIHNSPNFTIFQAETKLSYTLFQFQFKHHGQFAINCGRFKDTVRFLFSCQVEMQSSMGKNI